jgi:myo-inositol-1-phosphate synthase
MSIRVAIVGVGNCSSSLVQGVCLAKSGDGLLTGVTYDAIGGYEPKHIDFVIGFDVDTRKVGRPITQAIFSSPNCAYEIYKNTTSFVSGQVYSAPVLDGAAPHMLLGDDSERFILTNELPVSKELAVMLLKDNKVDILINYLPVGSQEATEFWAEVCIAAQVSMCNCIPVFIASDPSWEKRFIDAGICLIGDDMRSQFGASVLSQMLQELAMSRGHTVKCHIQRNVGGNTDFRNMEDKNRLVSKKISKENVLRGVDGANGAYLHAGPSEYIRYFGDSKKANFHIEMEGFGGAPVTLDAELNVEDSPNSAGVVIDAIRFLKVAREMRICGSLRGASAFTQKTPPKQMLFSEAVKECDALARREYTDSTRGQVLFSEPVKDWGQALS